jgi:hypothetical protein
MQPRASPTGQANAERGIIPTSPTTISKRRPSSTATNRHLQPAAPARVPVARVGVPALVLAMAVQEMARVVVQAREQAPAAGLALARVRASAQAQARVLA